MSMMNLEDFCVFILEASTASDPGERINIRYPTLCESVPSAIIDHVVYVGLCEGVWITSGKEGMNGEIYVPVEAFHDPGEHWDFSECEDLYAEVLGLDGRAFGPCGNCGSMTTKSCVGEFTYYYGKRLREDTVDYECFHNACSDCRWCFEHKNLIIGIIKQWGGRPHNVTRFNTYYDEAWDEPKKKPDIFARYMNG